MAANLRFWDFFPPLRRSYGAERLARSDSGRQLIPPTPPVPT
jgi:hypothetical protein